MAVITEQFGSPPYSCLTANSPSRKLTRGSFKDDKSISAKWSSTVSTLCFVVQRKLGKTQKDLKSFQSLLFSDNKSI